MSARNEEKDTLIASGNFRGHTKIKIQSVASSAGGTAMMAIVAQPYRGHLNGNVNDEFDMEECYARATVAGTRAQSLTVIVSSLDMQGMIGMMQVLAGRAHTILFFLLAGQLVNVTLSCKFIIDRWEVKICTRFSNWGEALCASETCETSWCMIEKATSGSWLNSNSEKPGQGPPRTQARRHGQRKDAEQQHDSLVVWFLHLLYLLHFTCFSLDSTEFIAQALCACLLSRK